MAIIVIKFQLCIKNEYRYQFLKMTSSNKMICAKTSKTWLQLTEQESKNHNAGKKQMRFRLTMLPAQTCTT